MPVRNYIYRYDWQSPVNKRYYRLEFIPQGANPDDGSYTDGSVTNVHPPDALSVPTIRVLPSNVFGRQPIEISTGFDALPIGIPSTTTLRLGIQMEELEGNSELTDFRSMLLNPTCTHPIQLLSYITPAVNPNYSNRGSPIYLSTVVTLFDRGTSGSENTVLFQGTQNHIPEREHSIDKRTGGHRFSVTFQDISRTILEAITPIYLCRYFLLHGTDLFHTAVNDHSITSGDQFDRQGFRSFFEIIFRAGSRGDINFGIMDRTAGTPDIGRLWRLSDLFLAIQRLADLLYKFFLRSATIEQHTTPVSLWRFRLESEYSDPTNYYGTPYDHIVFQKQNYNINGNAGSALNTRANIYFIGQIWSDAESDPPASGTDQYAYSHYLGGVLCDLSDNRSSLYSYSTVYDFLQEATEACFASARTAITFTDSNERNNFVHRFIFASALWGKSASSVTITTSEILQTDITLREGGLALSVAIPEAIGLGSGDMESQSMGYRRWGVRATQTLNLTYFFHNCPIVDEPISNYVNRFYADNDGYDTTGGFTLDYTCADGSYEASMVIVGRSGLRPNLLWYIDQPTGSNAKIPILPHHQVGIKEGSTTYYDGEPSMGNYPFGQTEEDATYNDENFMRPMLFKMQDMQAFSCLPNSVCKRAVLSFGSLQQVEMPSVILNATAVSSDDLTSFYYVGGLLGGASNFLRSGSYLDHLGNRGILTSVRADYGQDYTATCSFIALGPGYPKAL